LAALEPPAVAPGRLLTLRSGGWLLLLAGVFSAAILSYGLYGALTGKGGVGRPGRPETYGFDLSDCTVDRNLLAAAMPRDGLPALTSPQVFTLDEAAHFEHQMRAAHQGKFLVPTDRVIGVEIAGQARAYPLRILNWHEIVNDTLGDRPIVVTYSALCDSAVVFDRRTATGVREFGVSGLLYNSNLVMYDRSDTPSLWSQLQFRAISGPAVGEELRLLPASLTTWGQWQARCPQTTVLAPDRNRMRVYKQTYDAYYGEGKLRFPVAPLPSSGWPLMTRVVAVRTGGAESWRVYRASGDRAPDVPADLLNQTDTVAVPALWFAWYAQHPDADFVRPAAQ
jgi:hypothetical protein